MGPVDQLMVPGFKLANTCLLLLGRRQVVKAPGFDPGIRRFESSRPSHFFDREMPVIHENVLLSDHLYQVACNCSAGWQITFQ